MASREGSERLEMEGTGEREACSQYLVRSFEMRLHKSRLAEVSQYLRGALPDYSFQPTHPVRCGSLRSVALVGRAAELRIL